MTKAKLTPAMEQYMHFKRLYPDAILFFRMGDFYEMFYDDAKSASKILGLTLTARNHGKTSGEVPLAGIPYHSLENYLSKLIRNGQKVAICEQVEDPKNAKGVVKRDVVEVVSPGTALADSLLEGHRNNFLLGITWRVNKVGLAQIDLSTGDFILDEIGVKDLHDELKSIDPTELLISDKTDVREVEEIKKVLPKASFSYIEDWNFSDDTARSLLLEQFRTNSLKGFYYLFRILTILNIFPKIDLLFESNTEIVHALNNGISRKFEKLFPYFKISYFRKIEIDHNSFYGFKKSKFI